MKIKDLPDSEKPREKLIKFGVHNLSDSEILSIILRTGIKNYSVKDISLNLLKEIKEIKNLKNYNYYSLSKLKGIGSIKAMELAASIELGKRIFLNDVKQKIKVNNTRIVFELYNDYFKDIYQEQFICLYLDSKKNLIESKILFIGTINQSIVHPREVFKYAYKLSSSALICVHNHPSGDVTPSSDDINFTTRLKEIGKIMGIEVLDHIIIGYNIYYSFLEHGKM